MAFGWRLRICTMALALAMYLAISAMVSVSSIHGTHSSGVAARPEDIATGARSAGSRTLNEKHFEASSRSQQPRLSPRRLRSRFGPSIEWCHKLRFKPSPGPVTALASFPGSGNTWLRYLIQQATGQLTGSVYKDYALLKNGFPAESVTNGSVICVKTHEFGVDSIAAFDRAILLVRDPFASLQAEFNRRSGGHVGHASPEKYKRNNGKYWHGFVMNKGTEWEQMNLAWYNAFPPADRLVIRYEDLIADTEGVLRRVLIFLGEPEGQNLEAKLECALSRKEGIYKRSKKPHSIDVFDSDMRHHLVSHRVSLYTKLGLAVADQDLGFVQKSANGTTTTASSAALPRKP